MAWSHMLGALAYSNERAVSIFYCREAPGCNAIRQGIRDLAPKAGMNVVHEAAISLAQPFYTAEVIAAKNAGAKVIITIADNATVVRIIRSANQQGWKPVISTQGGSHDERFLKDGGKDVEGVTMGAFFPHWTAPFLADYLSALDRFVPGAIKGTFSIQGWAEGKLMESLARTFPPGPVSSADVLKSLYALRGETLGGLTPPLSYREGQPNEDANHCAVAMIVQNGTFVPKSNQYECVPGWHPIQK
jgi:branched-chain amino acid transport system substrate-binding protein